jgi:transposase
MAYYSITMNQVKQIYQLRQHGVSIKKIASILCISKNTVKGYLRKTEHLTNATQDPLTMDNPILEEYLKPISSQEKANYEEFLLRAEYYVSELSNRRKTHVTRMILWEEDYQAGHIHLKYSRFCYHLQRYLKSKHPSMVQQHQPGDKLFIDFAGDKLFITDRITGKKQPVETLLMTLGYSNYTLAIGIPSQRSEHLTEGFVKGVTELGAVPAAVVPDNMKSAVTVSDRYEPQINESFLDMANYYGMVVLPARPLKPKDKAKVEVHVNIVYQQAYSRLRHMTFYSLEELNVALSEKMKNLNDAIMQDYGVSRRVILERDERQTLKPLPPMPYQLVRQMKPTVMQNGHIKLKSIGKYLSVPYRLIGQKVTVLLSNGIARIYYQRECVATHVVSAGGLYVTKRDHLASAHQDYLDSMSPEVLKQKALAIGPEAEAIIVAVLAKAQHPEQAYKTCQGILALQFKCERKRYLQCCKMALANDLTSLRYMRHLVGSPHVMLQTLPAPQTSLPMHNNIRGSQHYQ